MLVNIACVGLGFCIYGIISILSKGSYKEEEFKNIFETTQDNIIGKVETITSNETDINKIEIEEI